jgi:hypothetical protein
VLAFFLEILHQLSQGFNRLEKVFKEAFMPCHNLKTLIYLMLNSSEVDSFMTIFLKVEKYRRFLIIEDSL